MHAMKSLAAFLAETYTMTLLAAVVIEETILLSADSGEVRSAGSERALNVPVVSAVTKFRTVGSYPVMWGAAGGAMLRSEIEPWIEKNGLDTPEQVLAAHAQLLALKKAHVAGRLREEDAGLDTRLLFAG
jgi:hypothetical protein